VPEQRLGVTVIITLAWALGPHSAFGVRRYVGKVVSFCCWGTDACPFGHGSLPAFALGLGLF
jgi:hypothetical protein